MIQLLSADLYLTCYNKAWTLLMAWGESVVHLRDRLFSCQLCGAYAFRFPPGGEGMRLMEP